MTYYNYSVDVEANGPCPGIYSMIEIGAVCLETDETFHARLAPITPEYSQGALHAIGTTHEHTLTYPHAETSMEQFYTWLINSGGSDANRRVFWSDNPGFDWQFVNYYLHRYCGENPFGFSSRRIGDLYAGMRRDHRSHSQWKRMRTCPHTHNALDDALGNAGALKQILSGAV